MATSRLVDTQGSNEQGVSPAAARLHDAYANLQRVVGQMSDLDLDKMDALVSIVKDADIAKIQNALLIADQVEHAHRHWKQLLAILGGLKDR